MASRRRERISVPSWKRHFVEKYQTDLIIRINRILERKGWSQQDLKEAIEPDWSKARVSQVLSGDKNLTLETISKLEDALGEDILEVPLSEDEEKERYAKLVEMVHERIQGEEARSLTLFRSTVLQFLEKQHSQERDSEKAEDSYSYASYR